MMKQTTRIRAIFAAVGMLLLILDSKTALTGAQDGIALCIKSVIPSLFPFFVLSIMLTGALAGREIFFMKQLGKLCRMPCGSESLLLVGLIGGYPVGAQSIARAYEAGQLQKADAHRLLGFCSNAGPSFIFGMLGSMFSAPEKVWLLWLVHILSAVFVGMLLPGKNTESAAMPKGKPVDLPNSLNLAAHVMAGVCGWIILFRIAAAFISRWFLWLLPQHFQAGCIGVLELANGCHMLHQVDNEAVRFILASVLLGFGGICVGMQTVSAVKELGTGMYFPGKLLQGLISLALSTSLQLGAGAFLLCIILIAIPGIRTKKVKKKAVAFSP